MPERSPKGPSKEFKKLMEDALNAPLNPVKLTSKQRERDNQLDAQIAFRLQRAVETSMQPMDLKGGWGLKLAGDEVSPGVAFNDAETASLEDLQRALEETPEEERRYPFTRRNSKESKE